MLAIIILLCGIMGLWVNIYSVFTVALFTAYYYISRKKARWEDALAIPGLILAALNIITVLVTRQF